MNAPAQIPDIKAIDLLPDSSSSESKKKGNVQV